MKTYSSIFEFDKALKKVKNKEIPLYNIGDQAVGHALEKELFGEVRGQGVPDLQIERFVDTISKNNNFASPTLDGQYRIKGWDYELKTIDETPSKLHILRIKRYKYNLNKLLELALDRIRRLYLVKKRKIYKESDYGSVIFTQAFRCTGINLDVFYDEVKHRYSQTHDSIEVYFNNWNVANNLYNKIIPV